MKANHHLPEHRRMPLILILCLTVFCSVLNGTMFNVAVPDIAQEFQLKPTDVSWVITGYVTLFALGALSFGKLADLFPIRKLIIIGLMVFNTGALLGLLSQSYYQLVLARLIQASGGSSIPALAMLTATRFVPAEQRGRVLGAIAATVAFAAGIGPMLGGVLGGFWDWRYLFLISTLTVLTLPAYFILLPRERAGNKPFDVCGALLTGIGVSGLLFFVVSLHWQGLLLSMASFTVLGLHLKRTEHPFLPTALLSNRVFLLSLATTFLAVGTVFGMMFLIPILLRSLHQLSTLKIGLTIFPAAMCASIMGLAAGYFADRIGALWVVRRGLPLLGIGFVLLTVWTDVPILLLVAFLMISYSGFAFIHASLAKTVSLLLPSQDTGVGMGLYNLVFFLSGAFGTAITSRLNEFFRDTNNLLFWVDQLARPFSLTFLCMACTVVAAMLVASRISIPPSDGS